MKYSKFERKFIKNRILKSMPKFIVINDNLQFELCYASKKDALVSIVCQYEEYVCLGHIKDFLNYCECYNIDFEELNTKIL